MCLNPSQIVSVMGFSINTINPKINAKETHNTYRQCCGCHEFPWPSGRGASPFVACFHPNDKYCALIIEYLIKVIFWFTIGQKF